MNVLIFLTGILSLAFTSCIDPFVVTRYDLATITNYYDHISKYFTSTSKMNEFFNYQNRSQFCHQLRESKFFDVTNNTDLFADADNFQNISKRFSIKPIFLSMEADQASVTLEHHGLHNNRVEELPTFRCLDPRGDLSRAISPGFVANTAFMSTYHRSYTDLMELDRSKAKWNAKLIAIIDAPAMIQGVPNFKKFLEARRGLQRDPLCDLKKLLKYRLCAVASLGLGHADHRYVYSLYNQPENDEESCQYLKGIDRTSGRYPKMLLCSVKLTKSQVFKSFYLSFDALKSNNVFFIQQVRNGSKYIYNAQYLYVPLLDHLQLYEEAFNNTDI